MTTNNNDLTTKKIEKLITKQTPNHQPNKRFPTRRRKKNDLIFHTEKKIQRKKNLFQDNWPLTSEKALRQKSKRNDDLFEFQKNKKKNEKIENSNLKLEKQNNMQEKEQKIQKITLKKQINFENYQENFKKLSFFIESNLKIFNILIVCIIVLIISFFINKKIESSNIQYCDSFSEILEQQNDITQFKNNDCVKCPLNGICENGRFIKCKRGYLKKNQECVDQTGIFVLLSKEIQNILIKKIINFNCNPSLNGIANSESLDEYELIQIINDQNTFSLFIITKWIEQYHLYPGYYNEKYGIGFMNFKFRYSQNPSYPMKCLIKKIIVNNWGNLVLFIISVITLIMFVIKFMKNKLFKNEANQILNAVKEKIQKQKINSQQFDTDPYITSNYLQFKFLNKNNFNVDKSCSNINDNEKNKKKTWEYINKELIKDTNIAKKNIKTDNGEEIIWEYI
ncbi:inner nuclear membrane protein heh2-related [Anaeramoeba flamelloides]|uniref:Inner nuclear membrane protein heh2-related n=1 Tax=Anaeramoeba flamelloides TaxID=1746091 RepID=A0AAV7ZXT0_9EUKA|nr:inner nuclear membrane protein heh2-related [Anaeramoeba flamelloides]